MNFLKASLVITLSLFGFGLPINPIGLNNDEELFVIERNRDANTVHYEVNLEANGHLSLKNPIEVFWIKSEQNNQKESLTWVQRKYGYGIKIKENNKDYVNFVLVCQKDKLLTLKKGKDQEFRVFVKLQNEEVILEKITINFDEGGSFMIPKVNHIVIHGYKETDGTKVEELIEG